MSEIPCLSRGGRIQSDRPYLVTVAARIGLVAPSSPAPSSPKRRWAGGGNRGARHEASTTTCPLRAIYPRDSICDPNSPNNDSNPTPPTTSIPPGTSTPSSHPAPGLPDANPRNDRTSNDHESDTPLLVARIVQLLQHLEHQHPIVLLATRVALARLGELCIQRPRNPSQLTASDSFINESPSPSDFAKRSSRSKNPGARIDSFSSFALSRFLHHPSRIRGILRTSLQVLFSRFS